MRGNNMTNLKDYLDKDVKDLLEKKILILMILM